MQLKIVSLNGRLLADSREISEMTGKRHDHLLRDIDSYVSILEKATDPNIGASEFFISSNYQDSTGRTLKCYLITRKGCDMVANKMTGEKGVLFTAAYVSQFAEMQEKLQTNVVPLDERKVRIELLRTALEHDQRFEKVEERIITIEQKIEEQITLDSGEQRKVQKAIARKIYEMVSDQNVRSDYFRQVHREIRDRWAVASYKDVRRHELEGLLKYIDAWKPRAA